MSQTRFIPEVANRQSFIVLDGRRRVLFLHGQDREQNFTKFFTELCAAGTPNPPLRSSLLHRKHMCSGLHEPPVNRMAPHLKLLGAGGAGRELATLHFGLAAAISCKFSVAVSMALCSWIYCGQLRSAASSHTVEVIDNKYCIRMIAVHCGVLQGSSKLISSQVHSTGLCQLSACNNQHISYLRSYSV